VPGDSPAGPPVTAGRSTPGRPGPPPGSLAPGAVAWCVTAALVGAVMAYTLLRSPTWWSIPRDPTDWDAARYLVHGHLASVYSPGTGLVSFPGFVVLSLPVVALADLLHLGTLGSGAGHSLRPTAWLLWGPWVSLAAGSIILVADSVARHLGVARTRRAVLSLVEAALVWQLAALWGHPEDALAVSVVLVAWLASERDHWTAAGWLTGVAVCLQPLVLLVVPLLVVTCPAGRRAWFCVRTVVISVVLVVPELVVSFRPTWDHLVQQPNYPTLDHPTPLLGLAPHLADVGGVTAVAAGPARLVSLVLCCAVAAVVYRHPQPPERMVWCFALCFALRSLLESVMDPYYVWPALALAVVVAARNRGLYFTLAALTGILVSGYAQGVDSPWRWWGPLVVGTAIVLAAAFPVAPRPSSADGDGGGDRSTARAGASPGVPAGDAPPGGRQLNQPTTSTITSADPASSAG